MKKLIVLCLMSAALTIYCSEARAYFLEWGQWQYAADILVENYQDDDSYYMGYRETPINQSMQVTADAAVAYGAVTSEPFKVNAYANTWADETMSGANALATAKGIIYNTFRIQGGYGVTKIKISGDLTGTLEGDLEGDSDSEATVLSGLYFSEKGTIQRNANLYTYDPLWFYEKEIYSVGPQFVVDEEFEFLRGATVGQWYEVAALVDARSSSRLTEYGNVFADCDIAGLRFDVSLYEEQKAVETVPEPASMLLFGIGALGFGVIRKKKKY